MEQKYQFLNVVIKMGLSTKKWTNITKSRLKYNICNFRIRFYFNIKPQTKEDNKLTAIQKSDPYEYLRNDEIS